MLNAAVGVSVGRDELPGIHQLLFARADPRAGWSAAFSRSIECKPENLIFLPHPQESSWILTLK
jgi:hypothetical protein